jgi:hypothetical protein
MSLTMLHYKLFNYDHQFERPTKLTIGPFLIQADDTHCSNISLLKKHRSYTFKINIKMERVLEKHERIKGATFETAIVSINESDLVDSILYNKVSEKKNIDDLCLLLSFLSGRRVYLETEIEDYHNVHYSDPVVSRNYIFFSSNIWSKLPKIAKMNLDAQFYNCIVSASMSDIFSISAYGSANLNAIYERWCKQNNVTKYKDKKIIEKAISKSIEITEDSIITRAQRKFINLIGQYGVDKKAIDDIYSRIKPFTNPSAIYKLKEFLRYYDLYPKKDNSDNFQRLKWINTIRNRITHDGNIPNDKNITWERMAEATGNIASIVSLIVSYYFAVIVLEINDDFCLQNTKKEIINYFETGTFRGKKIFDETFDQYMERIEHDWIEQGIYP